MIERSKMGNVIRLEDFERVEYPLNRFIRDRVDMGFISRFTKRDGRKGYSANYINECINGNKPMSATLDSDLKLLHQLLKSHPVKHNI